MARNQHFECIECEAVFKIKYELDETYYNVSFCPFCGAELDDDQKDEYETDIDDN